jgi:hypothetical protein
MAGLSAWIVTGIFLDGWYHNAFGDAIETFFTPWHAVLYSGLAAAGLALVLKFRSNLARGYAWKRALPNGYMLSLLGAAIFAAGGFIDFAWHEAFGFEASTEALLSPAHLLLATGGVLVVSGPLRGSWERLRRDRRGTWSEQFPAMISLLLVFSIFTFFTQFSNAYSHPSFLSDYVPVSEVQSYMRDVTIISYVLVPAGLSMAFILLAIKNWRLPAGSLTFILTVNAALMFSLGTGRGELDRWPVLVAALAGGVLADLLLIRLKPSAEATINLRLFAFVTPFASALFYMLALLLTGGISWSIHLWLGAPLMAGVSGLGLSYLITNPQQEEAT